jgi:hypothetical protein
MAGSISTEVNAKFKAFMSSVQHFFNIAFPAKLTHKKGSHTNTQISNKK